MEKGTFSIEWAEDDPGPCTFCGTALGRGPVGWRKHPDPVPLCGACLIGRHSGLGLALRVLGVQDPSETRAEDGYSLIDPLLTEDVAALVDKSDQLSDATLGRLRTLVRCSPRYAEQIALLESLAQEAGLPERDDRLSAGLLFSQEYERLLAAPDWQHPAEVLDPEGVIGISYEELIHLAEARIRRGESPEAAREIQHKLERAWREERAKRDCVETFVARLLEAEPEDAERLLRRAAREYRFHLRQRQEPEEEEKS